MGRKSTIDYWPEELRSKLFEFFRDKSITLEEAKQRSNDLIEEMGLDVDKLTTSAAQRAAARMEKVGKRIQQTREAAEMWMAKLGSNPQGEVGKLLNESLRTMFFEVNLVMQESDITEQNMSKTVGIMNKMALGLQRLEKAASDNEKREEQIIKKERERAANELKKFNKNNKSGVLDEATIIKIREQVYGVYE